MVLYSFRSGVSNRAARQRSAPEGFPSEGKLSPQATGCRLPMCIIHLIRLGMPCRGCLKTERASQYSTICRYYTWIYLNIRSSLDSIAVLRQVPCPRLLSFEKNCRRGAFSLRRQYSMALKICRRRLLSQRLLCGDGDGPLIAVEGGVYQGRIRRFRESGDQRHNQQPSHHGKGTRIDRGLQ